MTCVQVYVVDDSEAFLGAAGAVIAATDGFALAGCARSREDALAGLAQIMSSHSHRPDLVLMDVNLGSDDGIEVTREVRARHPDLAVVLVSTMRESELPIAVLECGAHAFLAKAGLSPATLRDVWQRRPRTV